MSGSTKGLFHGSKIAGKIANDRMFVVLDRFFNGTITDSALIACLASLNIGTQYTAKNGTGVRACFHHPRRSPHPRTMRTV